MHRFTPFPKQADAVDDKGGKGIHQSVVATQVGLAFACVDEQHFRRAFGLESVFDVRRECGASEADDAGVADYRAQVGGGESFDVANARGIPGRKRAAEVFAGACVGRVVLF